MSIFEFFDRILRTQSSAPAHFTIADDHLLDGVAQDAPTFFTPHKSYFEIRLKQMMLRDKREYWRGFRPFSTFVTGFLHDGQAREAPFLVGPDLLGERAQTLGGDSVEYRNLRIAGPYPYEGDDVQLFAGLSRTEAGNWAVQTLGLLETFAKAFDVSKVTQYIEIAAPLVKGIEGFLGMRDIELRMGLQRAYEQPVGRGGAGPSTLRARHELLLNLPDTGLDPLTIQRRFWVKDGRLFFGDRPETARPYQDADFLLFEIRPVLMRNDYTTFPFHAVNWQETVKAIWDGSERLARQKLRLTAATLVQCGDIVRPQRNALLKMYKQQFDEELAEYRTMFEESTDRDADTLLVKGVQRLSAVEEEDMAAVMAAARDDAGLDAVSAETLMDQLDF